MKYKLTVCGGTFDLLHKGHRKFLEKAFSISDKILIGVNTDKFCREHGKDPCHNQEERKAEVEKFLTEKGWLNRAEFHFHDDFLGCPAVKDTNLQAIVVSEETIKGAEEVNSQRKNNGLKELDIVIADIVKGEREEVISSSRIRNGEIDREGALYVDPDWIGKRLTLPQHLREELAKPFGKILQEIPDTLNSEQVITVGDETTKKFNEKKINQKLSIVDFVVKRQKKFDRLEELGFEQRIKTEAVENPAGEITWELFDAIAKSLNSSEREAILINGEEDLAVLPAILLSPLGLTIYYGQPDQGLVEVYVDESIKQRAKDLADKFKLS